MSELKENLSLFNEKLSTYPSCTLVAVSKTKPVETLQEAYDAGQRVFGENKVQEMCGKHEELPKDIQWHMIGHLQSNKVKYMVDFVALIHGVDKLKLLKEINKRAKSAEKVVDVLLQVHIAEEESKFGLSAEEVLEILASDAFADMSNVRVKGLMGMATNTDNQAQVRKEFKGLKALFEKAKTDFGHLPNTDFEVLSMGMSGDYQIALEEGSNMVRIGSAIFGARDYANA